MSFWKFNVIYIQRACFLIQVACVHPWTRQQLTTALYMCWCKQFVHMLDALEQQQQQSRRWAPEFAYEWILMGVCVHLAVDTIQNWGTQCLISRHHLWWIAMIWEDVRALVSYCIVWIRSGLPFPCPSLLWNRFEYLHLSSKGHFCCILLSSDSSVTAEWTRMS